LAKSVTDAAAFHQRPKTIDTRDSAYTDLKNYLSSHIEGESAPLQGIPCQGSRAFSLLYGSSLQPHGLKARNIMQEENNAIATLGFYYLS
jgi:hypothetical protein